MYLKKKPTEADQLKKIMTTSVMKGHWLQIPKTQIPKNWFEKQAYFIQGKKLIIMYNMEFQTNKQINAHCRT